MSRLPSLLKSPIPTLRHQPVGVRSAALVKPLPSPVHSSTVPKNRAATMSSFPSPLMSANCASDTWRSPSKPLRYCAVASVNPPLPSLSHSALWLNDGKGGFTDATAQYLKGFDGDRQVSEAQFADINGDGKLDIVAARFFGTVELWTGDGKGFTKAADLTPTGWWRSVGIGDFNNDGNLDIVAGNVGENTKYHPKDKQPITLYAGDFDH